MFCKKNHRSISYEKKWIKCTAEAGKSVSAHFIPNFIYILYEIVQRKIKNGNVEMMKSSIETVIIFKEFLWNF